MNTKSIVWIVIVVIVIVAGQDLLTHLLGLVDAASCGAVEQAIGACL